MYLDTCVVASSAACVFEMTPCDCAACMQGQTHFLIREYEQQGVEFAHMLMWEAEQVTGDVIFETVPERWYHAYQFFDQPVSTNVSSEAHPLQVWSISLSDIQETALTNICYTSTEGYLPHTGIEHWCGLMH